VIEVTAGHIQLSNPAPVAFATAGVSCNGGRTWRTAAVTAQGGGRFRVSFRAPAGAGVTLRGSARDAIGGSITETITRGYAVSH